MMTKPCSVCGTACSLTCSCRQRSYCSQACLKADWRTHKTNCPKVEERHISQAKGRGLVATRNIKKGLLETWMYWDLYDFPLFRISCVGRGPTVAAQESQRF